MSAPRVLSLFCYYRLIELRRTPTKTLFGPAWVGVLNRAEQKEGPLLLSKSDEPIIKEQPKVELAKITSKSGTFVNGAVYPAKFNYYATFK